MSEPKGQLTKNELHWNQIADILDKNEMYTKTFDAAKSF